MVRDKGEVFPPADIDPNSPGVKTVALAHRAVTGSDTRVICWPSVSDAGWLVRAGIPTAIYGHGSIKQAHIVNEYVEISDLLVAAKSIALTVATWAA